MFTLEQIKAAHAKVKSGADFPAYIQDLIKLGVQSYDSFVTDGHVDYSGKDNYKITASAKYEKLLIAEKSNTEQFQKDLKAHQQGKTDYPTFCKDCAKSGINKWVVNMIKMTCTYYDEKGNELLVEVIPQP